jgi:BirA family biotin operon repressor/biotin-[acetyl-CoA-carboxylase] ligase
LLNINQIYNLNIAIAVCSCYIPKLSIKWPNDIMSSNFKIGGILIEKLKSDGAVSSVVGWG